MYLDEKGKANTDLSQNGRLAVGVPGSVSGMFYTHQKFGKLPMSVLIQPAIDLAHKRFCYYRKKKQIYLMTPEKIF